MTIMNTQITPSADKAPVPALMPGLMPSMLLLGILCYFLFFFNLGGYSLFDMDEPRYAEAAREMLESGNWITPYFNYELRFDKPVFFYWLIALAYKWFGVSEFSARFFSAVNASFSAFMLLFVGARLGKLRLGLASAIIFATALEVVGLARMSVTDMTLATYMAGSTLALLMVVKESPKWWLVAALFSGLAILTKGPVGIVLPGSVLVLYTLLTGQFKTTFLNRWFPLALVVCAAIAIPWYVLAYLENGQIFVDALFKHNVSRFGGVVSGHDFPVYFFVPVLLIGFMPWTAFLPGSILFWAQNWFKKPFSLGSFREQIQQGGVTQQVALFSLVWVSFIFIFFTMSQTKLLTYILPLFPGLGLWLGAAFEALHEREVTAEAERLKRHWIISAGILAVLVGIAGVVFSYSPTTFLPREAKHLSDSLPAFAPTACLAIGVAFAAWLLSQRQYFQALVLKGVTMAMVVAMAVMKIVPLINEATQGAVLSYLKQAGDKPLITYEMTRPSLTFYARKKIIRVPQDDEKALHEMALQHPELYVITKNSFLDALNETNPEATDQTMIQKGHRYSLVLLRSKNKAIQNEALQADEPVLMQHIQEKPAGTPSQNH